MNTCQFKILGKKLGSDSIHALLLIHSPLLQTKGGVVLLFAVLGYQAVSCDV